jgi:hypothetical protein
MALSQGLSRAIRPHREDAIWLLGVIAEMLLALPATSSEDSG